MANDLARNGPRGRDSQDWMSRADQSLTKNAPNTWSANESTPIGEPSGDPTPTTKPTSASKSSRWDGPNVGPNVGPASAGRCPRGRVTGVPDSTTVPERPWYPTGRYFQLGIRASPPGRNSRPTLVAWFSLA